MKSVVTLIFILLSSQIPGAVARPGNAEIDRSGLVITKLFKKNHAGMQNDVLYNIEKNILIALEENTPERCRARRHFPRYFSGDDDQLTMRMAYMGSTLKYDERQFNDHPFICLKKEVDRADFQQQVDCILETLTNANVRHLDLQCGPAGEMSSLKHFNVAYDQHGTISLIDFELSTMNEIPEQWANRCCYYQKEFCTFEQYIDKVNQTFQKVVFPELKTKQCGHVAMYPTGDMHLLQQAKQYRRSIGDQITFFDQSLFPNGLPISQQKPKSQYELPEGTPPVPDGLPPLQEHHRSFEQEEIFRNRNMTVSDRPKVVDQKQADAMVSMHSHIQRAANSKNSGGGRQAVRDKLMKEEAAVPKSFTNFDMVRANHRMDSHFLGEQGSQSEYDATGYMRDVDEGFGAPPPVMFEQNPKLDARSIKIPKHQDVPFIGEHAVNVQHPTMGNYSRVAENYMVHKRLKEAVNHKTNVKRVQKKGKKKQMTMMQAAQVAERRNNERDDGKDWERDMAAMWEPIKSPPYRMEPPKTALRKFVQKGTAKKRYIQAKAKKVVTRLNPKQVGSGHHLALKENKAPVKVVKKVRSLDKVHSPYAEKRNNNHLNHNNNHVPRQVVSGVANSVNQHSLRSVVPRNKVESRPPHGPKKNDVKMRKVAHNEPHPSAHRVKKVLRKAVVPQRRRKEAPRRHVDRRKAVKSYRKEVHRYPSSLIDLSSAPVGANEERIAAVEEKQNLLLD